MEDFSKKLAMIITIGIEDNLRKPGYMIIVKKKY